MSVSNLYEYLCKRKPDIVDEKSAAELLKSIEKWIADNSTADLLHVPKRKREEVKATKEDMLIDSLFEQVCDRNGNCSGGDDQVYKIKFGKHKDKTFPELLKEKGGKSYLQWVLKQTWVYPDFVAECAKHGIKKNG